jgi:hypothetical protein
VSRELLLGELDRRRLEQPEVLEAAALGGIPSPPRRLFQRIGVKAGLPAYAARSAAWQMDIRRLVLGDKAAGEPRVLVRVDDFPHPRTLESPSQYGVHAFARFHSLMASAGVPYLLAVTPRLARDYLNPNADGGRPLTDEESALLRSLEQEGVTFGVHGLDHRTRDARPRHWSELCGLDPDGLEARLDRAETELRGRGIRSRVFVPPFNRFDPTQFQPLARRYPVICGGPEGVGLVGFRPSPAWWDGAVYMPAYPPAYGRVTPVALAIERLARKRAAVWAPVVLHWGWEAADGFAELERLAPRLQRYAWPWADFLAAVDASQ